MLEPAYENHHLILYTVIKELPQKPTDSNATNRSGKISCSTIDSGVKTTPNHTPEFIAKPAPKQGTKQKNNVQVKTGGNKSKAETTEEAAKSTSACIAPCPVFKERKSVAAHSKGDTNQSSKIYSSPTDNESVTTATEDPKTPACPLKKAQVNKDTEKNLNGTKPKSKPCQPGILPLIFKVPIDIENFDADVDNTESEDNTELSFALHPVIKERKSVAAPQKAGDADQSSKNCLNPTDNETITTTLED